MADMRYITKYILEDLEKKMVFIGGPRQVGKTTLVKSVLTNNYTSGRYFNWDFDDDRRSLLQKKWHKDQSLLIFDELHKFPKWKNWIKGIYDVLGGQHKFLVTGSARLDLYRRGGDSLLGRYHYWRLHPFTLDDIPAEIAPRDALERLMTVGGFPKPFLEGSKREARRWRRERLDRVIREDIRDLKNVRNIQSLSLLLDMLRTRVGGMITLANIATDLQVAHKTVKSWLDILETMYLLFAIYPYTKSLPRAVLKPPKVYFFDNGDVIGDRGAIFENLVASSLLKRLHLLEDRDGFRCELRYIRDKEGREVDFVIVKDGSIEELIEVKYADDRISKSLLYYSRRLKPKKTTQIVAQIDHPYTKDGINVVDPISYFNGELQ